MMRPSRMESGDWYAQLCESPSMLIRSGWGDFEDALEWVSGPIDASIRTPIRYLRERFLTSW